MARAAVASGRCAVIGLQSTGEARTNDVISEKGEELDEFVSGGLLGGSLVSRRGAFNALPRSAAGSARHAGGHCARETSACVAIAQRFVINHNHSIGAGPKELLLKLVENYYPLPHDPYDEEAEAGKLRSHA